MEQQVKQQAEQQAEQQHAQQQQETVPSPLVVHVCCTLQDWEPEEVYI